MKKNMFGFEMPKPQEKAKSFRDMAGWRYVRERMLTAPPEEDGQQKLIEDIVDRVVSTPNELSSFGRESGFHDKIKERAAEALDEFLKREKSLGTSIDMLASAGGWDNKIAMSKDEAAEQSAINQMERSLSQEMSRRISREDLVKQIIAIMVEQEEARKNKERNIQ